MPNPPAPPDGCFVIFPPRFAFCFSVGTHPSEPRMSGLVRKIPILRVPEDGEGVCRGGDGRCRMHERELLRHRRTGMGGG